MRRFLQRALNAARRVADGVPRGGEAVWPGVKNDLFVAHESIYRFASTHARGQRVLDAACGTGYGSAILAEAGAASVIGVDLNLRHLAYAHRNFRHPCLRFERCDCSALPFAPDSFDLIVSSNTLEHVPEPVVFLRSARDLLTSAGTLLVAVPPVLSAADLEVHGSNPHHQSNLSVSGWADLLAQVGWLFDFFCHRCTAPLDFSSPFPSRVPTSAFSFVQAPVPQAYIDPPITAIFRCRRAA